MTKIIKCICKHIQQDEMYGSQMRVMNIVNKDKNTTTHTSNFKCTVCESISKSISYI